MRASSITVAICGLALLVSASVGARDRQSGGPPTMLGPPIGTAVPPFSGTDQFGKSQTLESALGDNGAMLVFYRSADW
jgi:hypothetical protein